MRTMKVVVYPLGSGLACPDMDTAHVLVRRERGPSAIGAVIVKGVGMNSKTVTQVCYAADATIVWDDGKPAKRRKRGGK